MKRKLGLILGSALVAVAANAFADGNVNVINPTTRPVPVQQIARVGTTSLAPVYYSTHITTNTTTTVTSSTAYISSLTLTVTVVGTTEVVQVRNKEGTPKVLYQQGSPLVAGTYVYNFANGPIVMTNGIDIVTSGGGAATIDVFISYFQ